MVIVAKLNLELYQMNVKIVLANEKLKEEYTWDNQVALRLKARG